MSHLHTKSGNFVDVLGTDEVLGADRAQDLTSDVNGAVVNRPAGRVHVALERAFHIGPVQVVGPVVNEFLTALDVRASEVEGVRNATVDDLHQRRVLSRRPTPDEVADLADR